MGESVVKAWGAGAVIETVPRSLPEESEALEVRGAFVGDGLCAPPEGGFKTQPWLATFSAGLAGSGDGSRRERGPRSCLFEGDSGLAMVRIFDAERVGLTMSLIRCR